MNKAIAFVLMVGAALAASRLQAQTAEVDHISTAQILEKAKSLEQAASASGGSAAITLAKYPHHFTMISLRQKDGGAEIHQKFADIFYVIRGEATLTSGGTIVEGKEVTPGEIKGSSIAGGTQISLHEGDFVHIPANVPHQLFLPKGGEFVYFVIKVQEE